MGCGSVSSFSSPLKSFQVRSIRAAIANFDYDFEINDNANANGRLQSVTRAQDVHDVKLIDGTVSSPYPNAATVNQFQIPTPLVTFWVFLHEHIHRVISVRGQHWDWLIEIATPRVRLKYSEIEPKSRRLASALYKLGVREKAIVIFYTKNISIVNLLYFAVWRLNAVVQIVDSVASFDGQGHSDQYFVICDRSTELAIIEFLKKSKQEVILFSIGKLRRTLSVDISDLLLDDGSGSPDHVNGEGTKDDIILITSNGSCHSNTSLILAFTHLGLLRHAGSYPRQYFYPSNSGDKEQVHEHVITTIFWPLAALMFGKTMILFDSPIIQSVTLVMREFAVTSLCGCPELLQRISRHIAEQGGSMSSVTSIVLHSTSTTTFSEKILRKGFPNLRVIDVVYGFEEILFVTSTIPPPTLVNDQEIDFRTKFPNNSGPLLHPHTTGTLGLCAIAKIVDMDTGVRLGPGEPGELCFKSGTAMQHYLTNPKRKKTLVDGWIFSGDFGHYDSSGSFYITGRVDEVFKYYADYISPRELECVLQMHPEVQTCAVLGIPDELSGHLPCGVIVKKSGSSVGSKEIRTFVNSRVSNSKQLRGGIVFLEELPASNELTAFRQHIQNYIQRHISHST